MKRNETKRYPNYMEIDGKRFTRRTIEVLQGEEGVEDLRDEWIPIAEALDYPEKFPFLVSDILDVEKSKELRRALIRIQIDAQLQLNRDLDFYKKQLFISETIELLLFHRLRLRPRRKRKKKKDDEEKDEKKDLQGKEAPVDDEETDDEETDDEETDDEED